jgi:AraC family transcriptional regulator
MAKSQLGAGEFYGEVLGKFPGQGLILSELKHKHARKLPNHTHELAYFCLLLDGGYSERLAQKVIDYKPMTIMFHPPSTTHGDEIGRHGGHFFSIEIQQQWLDRLREYTGTCDLSADLHGGDLVWLATRLFREYKNLNDCSPLAIEGLLLEMLAVVGRAKETKERREPAWLARVVELLHADFRQRITLNHIAKSVGIHPLHLSKVFRQFRRQNIGDYTNRLRIQYCCRELSDPEVDLATLAVAAGFADQSHLTRTFKKLTGLTPRTFRSTVLGGSHRFPTTPTS